MKERSRQKNYRGGRNRSKEAHQRFKKDRPRREQRGRNRYEPEELQLGHVNRNEVCPFLALNHYSKQEDAPKDRQLLLYLWMNSTLKEISDLLRAHLPIIRTKQRFIFTRVYWQGGKAYRQEMGTVMVHKKEKKGFEKEQTTLKDHHFYVSINYK